MARRFAVPPSTVSRRGGDNRRQASTPGEAEGATTHSQTAVCSVVPGGTEGALQQSCSLPAGAHSGFIRTQMSTSAHSPGLCCSTGLRTPYLADLPLAPYLLLHTRMRSWDPLSHHMLVQWVLAWLQWGTFASISTTTHCPTAGLLGDHCWAQEKV